MFQKYSTKEPLVSIVIPVYNGAKYLAEAIESALAQSYQPIEVLVINDGSNDDGRTRAVALSFGDRIRYFEKENGGVATALNLGIREMKGEYFSWLSHDDVYYPEKIRLQFEKAKLSDRYEIIYSDYDCIDACSAFHSSEYIGYIDPNKMQYEIINSYPLNGCALLIPKHCFDVVGGFNESRRTTQDYEMWFRLSELFEYSYAKGSVLGSREHDEQGIRTIGTHQQECNDLYIWLLEHTAVESLKRAFPDLSVADTYLQLSVSLIKRGYTAYRTAIKLFVLNSRLTEIFNMYKVGPILRFMFKYESLRILSVCYHKLKALRGQ